MGDLEKTKAPKPMAKPKSGGKPELITTINPPGGPHTPGAKRARAAQRIANKKAAHQ